jgi:prepilin-type N-terminal cleavage/methylation domain-containing protein
MGSRPRHNAARDRRYGFILPGNAGFSLPELMVVLTIIGIVLVVAIPNFARITARDKVETAAYDLERNVALARQKAIAKRRPYRLTVNSYDGSYYVERKEGSQWVRDPDELFSLPETVELDLELGGDLTNCDLSFEPHGTIAANDAPAYFTFHNERADTALVSVVRTGRIRTRVH